MFILNHASQRRSLGHGNFQIDITLPGINMHVREDPGLINLGRFDHGYLRPGAFIAMHKHRNDEILSLLKSGTLLHRDSTGQVVPITPNHLMMMNAGSGIFHEESIPSDRYGEEVEMLQIFIRPAVADEEPLVQFADMADGSDNKWRLVAGPVLSDAPLKVRSDIFVYDCGVREDVPVLPPPPFLHTTYLVYVFAGRLGHPTKGPFETGDSLVIRDEPGLAFSHTASATLVAFVINTDAGYTRAGMFSGML